MQYGMQSEWIGQILHGPLKERSSFRVALHQRPIGATGLATEPLKAKQ